MDSFVAWLSLCSCALLAVECVVLYLDGKGQRKAIAALRSQVAGLSQGPTLEHALARRMVLPSPPRGAPRPALERRAVQQARATPPAPATDDRHTVELPAAPAGAEGVLDAFMLGIAHSARAGIRATHCDGKRCGGEVDAICECECATCSRRRTLLEKAIVQVRGPQADAEFTALRVLQAGQHAALVGRVMGRYQAPQESNGEPAPAHCGGAECFLVEATSEACGCGCPSCRVALG